MNFHPPVSSAPAIFLTVGLLLGMASFAAGSLRPGLGSLSRALFLLGALALPFSYFSGLASQELLTQATVQKAGSFIETHEGLGRFAFFSSFVPLLFLILERVMEDGPAKRLFSALFALSFFALTLLVDYTSFLGGRLVFGHGAGVESAEPH